MARTHASASEIVRRVAARKVSPVEVLEAALERVARANPIVNGLVTLDDTARDQAERLEEALGRGEEPGPLCGVPVGIKDVTPVAGVRTTYGSPHFADYVPDRDALVVERLRRAGAILLGKTNTPEFAAGANTFNDVFGATTNPWDPARSAGGSTGGGAAALSTGMIGVAEGTDLGGSLRIPAAFCGVVGIRPSTGLVPTWPSNWPWDDLSVTGPMARTAEDTARALAVMAGPDPRCPGVVHASTADFVSQARGASLAGLRLAYCPDLTGIGVDEGIAVACREGVERLAAGGAEVRDVPLDLAEGRDAFLHLRGHWFVAHHHAWIDRLDDLGPNVRTNLESGLRVTTQQLAEAHRVRARIWRRIGRLLEDHDFILSPTTAVAPFPVEQSHPESVGGRPMETYVDWFAPTFVLSLTGLPVASAPCGLDPDGLPVGLQVLGPGLSDGRVLGLAGRIHESSGVDAPDLAGPPSADAGHADMG